MEFELSILLHPITLGLFLALCLGVFVALSFALVYHWKEYGMNTRLIRLAPLVHVAVSGALFALIIISYLIFL